MQSNTRASIIAAVRVSSAYACAALLAACTFDSSTPNSLLDEQTDIDAGQDTIDADLTLPDALADAAEMQPDAVPGSPDATPCDTWTKPPLLFDACSDIPFVTTSLVLDLPGRYIYDTDASLLTDPGGGTSSPTTVDIGDARAIVVGRFQISDGARFLVLGSKPLLIVSWNDIVINDLLNLKSRPDQGDPDNPAADIVGAGGNSGDCLDAEDGGQENNGGSGGGGGGFATAGGKGGNGRVNNQNEEGGLGGAASATPLTLRGGCPGGDGGEGNGAGAGARGNGGGAVYLNARTSITVNDIIQAGGSGGHRATGGRSAGGGGGSGGLIGLEAASITIGPLGVLAANGGGGGGGGNNNANNSASGESGNATRSAAVGGIGDPGENPAGDGGDGGFRDDDTPAAKLGSSGNRGGGGGGGAAGFIILSTIGTATIDAAAVISPAPTSTITQ